MADEKKPETAERASPVVVRKGHLKPTPPGEAPQPPVEERLEPAPTTGSDNRPQWQRIAEKAASAAPGAPAPSGAGDRGHGGRPAGRGPRGGPGDRARGERRDGPRRPRGDAPEPRERGAERAARPAPGPAEPPPLPEAQVPDEGSFEDMLAGAGSQARRRYEVGEKIAGKIIQIGEDVTFLELGSGIAEGMIETVELKDAQGNVTARPGDIIDGVVVKASDRGVVVSKGLGRHHRDREAVIEAARTGLPVEGVVKGANKGGLEVEVLGQRAFCPMSQIDVRFVGDPATFVGQKLEFRVQRADQRDVVVSRRALLEERKAEQARRTREKLEPGAVFDGSVTSVQEYGAFVDLGGLEGLVHVSELAWDRVSKPADLLKAGDPIRVQVLRIDQDPKKGERISLSVKALVPRPEPEPAAPAPGRADAPARAMVAPPPPPKVGDVVQATVDKVEPFGVFVRFAGGRGLVPASESGTPRGSDLKRSFKAGDSLTCLVASIDEQGRFRLSKTGAEAAQERAEAREYLARAQPRPSGKGFGTLGDLLREKLKK